MKSLVDENDRGSLKARPIPAVPVTVIASEENLHDPEHGDVWDELQHELAGMSPDSTYVVAKNSGHFVMVERPRVVLDAIRDVLARSA